MATIITEYGSSWNNNSDLWFSTTDILRKMNVDYMGGFVSLAWTLHIWNNHKGFI